MESHEKLALSPVFSTFKRAFRIWLKNFFKFAMIYVWGLLYMAIPIAILLILWLSNSFKLLNNNIIFGIAIISITVLAILFLLYYLIRIVIAFFLLVKHNYVGRELDIYRESAHYFWSYLFLKILVVIIVLFPFWIFIIPIMLIPITSLIIIIGLHILAIIAMVIVAVIYSLAIYVLFFENKTGISALARSRALITNYWWAMAWRILFIIIIFLLLKLVLVLPLIFILFPHWSLFSGALVIAWSILINIIAYLIIPFILLFFYHIYQDLVKIKK